MVLHDGHEEVAESIIIEWMCKLKRRDRQTRKVMIEEVMEMMEILKRGTLEKPTQGMELTHLRSSVWFYPLKMMKDESSSFSSSQKHEKSAWRQHSTHSARPTDSSHHSSFRRLTTWKRSSNLHVFHSGLTSMLFPLSDNESQKTGEEISTNQLPLFMIFVRSILLSQYLDSPSRWLIKEWAAHNIKLLLTQDSDWKLMKSKVIIRSKAIHRVIRINVRTRRCACSVHGMKVTHDHEDEGCGSIISRTDRPRGCW